MLRLEKHGGHELLGFHVRADLAIGREGRALYAVLSRVQRRLLEAPLSRMWNSKQRIQNFSVTVSVVITFAAA